MSPDPVITQARLDSNWDAINFALDVPAKGRVERLLLRLRIPEATARVLVSTPTLRRSWLIAMGLALFFTLTVVGNSSDAGATDPFLFLVIAPLVPTLGVLMAYGPGADPAHEVTVTTPIAGIKLLLLRASAVFALSLPVIALVGVALPDHSWLAAGWILPALALTSLALVGTTFVSPRQASVSVSVMWLVVMIIANNTVTQVADTFGPAGQLIALVTLGVAGAALFMRREHFDQLGLQL